MFISMHSKHVDWIKGTNIYEVNIRQYTEEGTFSAFARHLPRLKDMGVEVLWLMPITPISVHKRQGTLGSYYACRSYTDINPEFGTLEDFKSLIKEVHYHDMKIIIDWVANHTGWDHHWAYEHAEWYVKDSEGNFTERNGWHDVIDLDYSNAPMRVAMINAMQYWIQECDIDGFRCDMAHLVPLDFWKTARKECEHLKKLFWLAECDIPDYLQVFDVSYAWDWMHITEKLAKEIATVQHMKDVLDKYALQSYNGYKLFFTSNHDENSWNGTEYEKYGEAAKAFAVFSCTWPGIPLVYSGQELPNYKRLKFFDKDTIEWQANISLHNFYKTLLELRKKNKAFLENATLEILDTGINDRVLAYFLQNAEDKVLLLINFSSGEKIHVSLKHENLKGNYYNLFSELVFTFNDTMNFELQPWEYFVYVFKPASDE